MSTTTEREYNLRLDKACDISGYASTDTSRFVITHVHLREDFLEATDGRMMVRIPYPPTATDETVDRKGLDAMVPALTVKKALRDAGKAGVVDAHVNGAVSLIVPGGVTHKAEKVDGQYPQTDKVWPGKEPTFSITLAAELLAKLAEHAAKHGKRNGTCTGIRFDFTADCEAVRFSYALGPDRQATGVLMPMRMA